MGGFTFGKSKKEGILLLFTHFGDKIYRVMVRYTRYRVFEARGENLENIRKNQDIPRYKEIWKP